MYKNLQPYQMLVKFEDILDAKDIKLSKKKEREEEEKKKLKKKQKNLNLLQGKDTQLILGIFWIKI